MKRKLTNAIAHWEHIAPIVKYPKNHQEYDELVAELDELLQIVGNDENHRLMGLVDVISNLIATYEAEHFPAPKTKAIDALKLLMQANQLRQTDLTEIGSQGVISEILCGKRQLNLRQIKLLAKRFHVDIATFID